MTKRKDLWIILFLLLIGLIFRLYNFQNFLFWSDDEQQQWYMLRHIIVDRHPSLVMPNAALGVGLNPIYHYFLVPFYLFAKFNPITLQTLGLIFYFFNLPLLYLVAKNFFGRKVGVISSFLYAFSFVSSLFDKRLWALSPNFFVVLLTLFALGRIMEKKYRYSLLLIPALVLPFSSDPSLGIVLLPIAFFLAKKILPFKIFALIAFAAILFLAPLSIFEVRHDFQNTRSFIHTISTYQNQSIRNDVANNNFLLSQVENFSRFFFLQSSHTAEAIFCYCFLDDKIPVLFTTLVIVIIGIFTYIAFKSKNQKYFFAVVLFSFLYFWKIHISKRF